MMIGGPVAGAVTVVKHGAEPVEVFVGSERHQFVVPPVESVGDTTGAGDAFAAGFLSIGIDALEGACRAGCEAAASLIASR